MMRGFVAIASICLCVLSGCAALQSTEEVALRYNRAFADTRNEMLVLNVLRSAAREPMQFSTMGTVSGQVGNGGSISIPFTNVIAGGPDIISPSLQITDAVNPTINIVPLGAKEFVTGILTPISTDDIQLFLHGAWDAEFLLPLVIGAVVCPDGRVLHNRGAHGGETELEAFRRFFADSASTFRIDSENASPNQRVLTLTDRETADLLRQGVGGNYRIASIADGAAGQKRVTIAPLEDTGVVGLAITQLCRDIPDRRPPGARGTRAAMALQGVRGGSAGERIILRSVQTIIYFLGETHRDRLDPDGHDPRGFIYLGPADADGARERQILFRLQAGASAGEDAVAVTFHGRRYFIPRLRLGEAEPLPRDRTLKTLSFLDQLIALQTSENSIRSTQPILAITQ